MHPGGGWFGPKNCMYPQKLHIKIKINRVFSPFLKRSLACSIAEVPVSLKLENCYYLKPLVVISSSSQIRGDNRV